jgi:hypothetical protein
VPWQILLLHLSLSLIVDGMQELRQPESKKVGEGEGGAVDCVGGGLGGRGTGSHPRKGVPAVERAVEIMLPLCR